MLITDLGREVVPARASDRKMSAKVRLPAPIPKAPILRKLRRETPSQYRLLGPKMVNMTTPWWEAGRVGDRLFEAASVSAGAPIQTESAAECNFIYNYTLIYGTGHAKIGPRFN